MTNATSEASRGGSIFWRLYMLCWVGLAGAALLYLSAAVLQPDLLKPLVPQPVAQSSGQDDVVSTKLETLQRSLDSLENKIASVENKVREAAAAAPAQPVVLKREATKDVAAAPAIPVVAPSVIAESVKKEQQHVERAIVPRSRRLPPLPARAPQRKQVASAQATSNGAEVPLVILNGVAAAGIATGSVDRAQARQETATSVARSSLPEIIPADPNKASQRTKPVIAFGRPTVQATPTGGGTNAIVVSVAGSVDKLRSDWDLLSARHPELLRNLQPRYDIMAANGPYRLLAGPLTSRSEAGQLCNVLQLHGVTCDVEDNFLGNAL
ncbi:MAG: hypothetical protein AAGD43_15140 [Pseudomonadota bacterium]